MPPAAELVTLGGAVGGSSLPAPCPCHGRSRSAEGCAPSIPYPALPRPCSLIVAGSPCGACQGLVGKGWQVQDTAPTVDSGDETTFDAIPKQESWEQSKGEGELLSWHLPPGWVIPCAFG